MRFIPLLVLTILFMACSGPAEQPPYTGDSWTDVQQRGHGTLTAVYVPAEGFAYFPNSLTYDDTTIPQTEMQENLLTGVTVELLRDFAVFVRQEYGVDLTLNFVEETNWRTFYADVAASKDGVIGMGNVTITEARRSELAFSLPYMTNIASLITHENAPLLEDLSQMGAVWSGRTALAFEATLHEERLRALTDAYYADAAIELVRSNDEIIDRLSEGDRYFAYIDLYNYWRAAERGAPLKRHPAGDESAEEFGYIMPLGTTWQPVLDAWFNADGGLTSTPRYRAIMEEHLGSVLAGILLDQ